MNLGFFESVIMGFISGLTETLPVSAEAHRTLLGTLLGVSPDPVTLLFIHMGCMAGLYTCFHGEIARLSRTAAQLKIPAKRRRKTVNAADASFLRLLRSAAMVLILCKLFTRPLSFIGEKLYLLPSVLVVNGILLLIPRLTRSGNMDARNMPRMYGWLMGFGGGLSVVPGISLLGAAMSLGQWRGAERKFALKFAGLLLMVGLGCNCVFDIAAMFSGTLAFSGAGLLNAFLGAVAAAVGCWLGMRLLVFIAEWTGFSAFAYYSWGMALLLFLLFLMI